MDAITYSTARKKLVETMERLLIIPGKAKCAVCIDPFIVCEVKQHFF